MTIAVPAVPEIPRPYALFLGDIVEPLYAKTALGLCRTPKKSAVESNPSQPTCQNRLR